MPSQSDYFHWKWVLHDLTRSHHPRFSSLASHFTSTYWLGKDTKESHANIPVKYTVILQGVSCAQQSKRKNAMTTCAFFLLLFILQKCTIGTRKLAHASESTRNRCGASNRLSPTGYSQEKEKAMTSEIRQIKRITLLD